MHAGRTAPELVDAAAGQMTSQNVPLIGAIYNACAPTLEPVAR